MLVVDGNESNIQWIEFGTELSKRRWWRARQRSVGVGVLAINRFGYIFSSQGYYGICFHWL